jgi:hypothetical protein
MTSLGYRIADLQFPRLPWTEFVLRRRGRNPPGRDAPRKENEYRYGNCCMTERCRISRKTARYSTFRKFVISGMGFTRGSLHPASGSDEEVVPSLRRPRGFTPGGYGGVHPSWNSPVASGHDFSRRPSRSLQEGKKERGLAGHVPGIRMVAPPRIELGTRGFSVLCSTI